MIKRGSKNKLCFEIVNSGIFNDLKSFDEFNIRILNNYDFNKRGQDKTKGDIFEIFCEAYLFTKKELQIKEVFPQGYVPFYILKKLNLNTNDKGYDGVYQTTDGNYFTYQCKYRSKNEKLNWQGKNGLSSFIAVSEKAYRRHLLATVNNPSPEFLRQDRILTTLRTEFNLLNKDDFLKIENFLKSEKITDQLHKPDPYQQEAVNKILKELNIANKTTAIMACGTGKTEIALWTYQRMKPNVALVLVPSIALVKQIRASWLSQLNQPVVTFQLCSSKDITEGEDSIRVRKNDLNMEFYDGVDGVNELKKWLKKNKKNKKIIFSTYQSSRQLKNIFNKINPIDFAFFDEAHRTAGQGKVDSNFRFALFDKNIPIRKRLFMTATRRIMSKKILKEGDAVPKISMEDEEYYGKVCYTLSFLSAANKKAIARPKLIISEVFLDEIDQKRRTISSTHVSGVKLKSDYLAHMIAMQKTVKKYNIKKIFTFHSKVSRASQFTNGDGPDSIKFYLKDFFVSHVNGSMKMRKRDLIMQEFKSSKKGIVSNARCLVEGVDVPSVDMVSFIDSKNSEIEIVQAIGRALRNRGVKKKNGYVFIPIFIERKINETLEESLNRTKFDAIVIILKALREHDGEIAKIIEEILVSESRGKGFAEESYKKLKNILEFSNPEIKKSIMFKAVGASVIGNLRFKWDFMIGRLLAYKDKYGHSNIPFNNNEFTEERKWVSKIRLRYRDKKLYNFQIEQLKKIGFSFVEPGATTYNRDKLLSTRDLSKKFGINKVPVIRALNKIKPEQMYFGSGIKKPLPLYKNYTEKEFCKILGVDFLKLNNNKYQPLSNISKNLNVDRIVVENLIKENKIKYFGTAIGSGGAGGITRYYKKISKKEFNKIKGITTSGIKGLYPARNLHQSIFSSKEIKNYGQNLIHKLIKQKKINSVETRISGTRSGIAHYYKPLSKDFITKITGVNIFNPDNYVTKNKFVKNIMDKPLMGYFNLCEKEGLIKPVGLGISSVQSTGGVAHFYKQLNKKEFMNLKKIKYLGNIPKNLCGITNFAKFYNVDKGVIKKMITNNFIKINCQAYIDSGITNLYKKISKKKFSEFYKIYRSKIVNKN